MFYLPVIRFNTTRHSFSWLSASQVCLIHITIARKSTIIRVTVWIITDGHGERWYWWGIYWFINRSLTSYKQNVNYVHHENTLRNDKTTLHILAFTRKDHVLYKKANDTINMDFTITGQVNARSQQLLQNSDRLQQVDDYVSGCTWQLQLAIHI